MVRILLSLILLMVSFVCAPQTAHASSAMEMIENGFDNITISINESSSLRVTGAAGQILSVYNITGVRVICVKVDSSDKSYNLNLPKGCYIVKVGKVVRKVSIR